MIFTIRLVRGGNIYVYEVRSYREKDAVDNFLHIKPLR